jgi:hypothetical protein
MLVNKVVAADREKLQTSVEKPRKIEARLQAL